MKKQSDEITIKELINIFLPKIWLIALVAVAFAALLGGYSMFIKEDTYTSRASFIMVKIPTQYSSDNNSIAVTTGLSESEISAMQSMIGMSEQVMETAEYLTTVKEELVKRDPAYSTITVAQLREMLSIEIVGDATCFDLSAVSNDPKLSYNVTDIVYCTFADVIEDVFDSYSITIKDIDPPVQATAPNSKGTVKNAIIGFLGGAILSMLVVFVISKLDVVIRSKDKIEANFDIPILGVIPRFEYDD